MSRVARPICVLATLCVVACSDREPTAITRGGDVPITPELWLGQLIGGEGRAQAFPVLVGAGDIARCYPGNDFRAAIPASQTPAESTAILLDHLPGVVMAVGDNAYEFGSPMDYATCYDPTWGRHKARTRPATGNHEYLTPGATGYFTYFGAAAHPETNGYYSYDIAGWHVVVLNSTPQWAACPPLPPRSTAEQGRLCVGDAAQRAWLSLDLAAHPALCTIAYFHHPRFSSGEHGNQYEMQQFWDMLYAKGVDVVVSGHDHDYERFAPQNPDGRADPTRGIREFVVGTGGAELRRFRTPPVANSQVRIAGTYGVLALALGDGRYGWAFVATSGRRVRDAGGGRCHI